MYTYQLLDSIYIIVNNSTVGPFNVFQYAWEEDIEYMFGILSSKRHLPVYLVWQAVPHAIALRSDQSHLL